MLVLKNPLTQPDSLYFPLPLALLNGKLVLLRQCPEFEADLIGKEVTAINGVPSSQIVASLLQYAAADGGGTRFAEGLVQLNLPVLITQYFASPPAYEVGAAGRTLQVQAIRTVRAEVPRYPLGWRALRATMTRGPNALHLGPPDSAAILVVSTFSRADKAFFRRAFGRIEDAKPSGLILDLRGNTGGSRTAAVALTKRLVNAAFGYSLIRPKGQNLRPFLNRKGKTYLTLGSLKYGLGAAFRSRHTPLGKEYRYRYMPAKNPFNRPVAVLTNGLTFSASTMVTSWLKQYSKAVFVGQQAAGGYNGNNGGVFPRLTLPYSGMVIQIPAYRLVLDAASAQRTGIVPDVPVPLTTSDLLSGRDAELEAAKQVLGHRAKEQAE